LVFRSPKEAAAIRKQSGMMVNGKKVTCIDEVTIEFFKPQSNPIQEQTSDLITKLTTLITSRYDTSSKFLNLTRLIEDPLFLSTNLKGFSHSTLGKKFGVALCKLIADQCPDIKTLSLENNRITNTMFFSTLSKRIPDLENISFKDNFIKNLDDLLPFHGKEFKNLRELILEGNPIRERELSKPGGLINFRRCC
jgi:nuclear RNA export factor